MNEALKTQLKTLKLSDIKPNFSERARLYDLDRRTVKKYYDGYEGKSAHRNKPSKLLIHHPCNRSGRCHTIKHMRSAIFSFFDDRDIMFAAFRTGIVDTVVFNHFYFCGNEYKFTTYKLLANLYQWSITYRTDAVFFRKIQIFPCNRDTFKTLCVRCP